MITKLIIIVPVIVALAIPVANVNASGLSRSDFPDHPEAVCMTYGGDPEMKDLCKNTNICDDSAEIKRTHKFCTGELVRNIPYPPGGCPEGYHSSEGDEDGLCHTNEGGCRWKGDVFTNDKENCIDGDECEFNPASSECVSKRIYCYAEDISKKMG